MAFAAPPPAAARKIWPPAQAALDDAGQEVWPSLLTNGSVVALLELGVSGGSCFRLLRLHGIPECLIDDAQGRFVPDDPISLGIDPRAPTKATFLCGHLDPPPPIEDAASHVRVVVQDAFAERRVSRQGGGVPNSGVVGALLPCSRRGDAFQRETTGPQASTLRYALRTPSLDRHLERIANFAVQPSVRALALNALIDRKAEWPSGTAWQWVDKSMGLRRRVTVFDHRLLTVAPPHGALIAGGVSDRSAVVRKAALTGVIRHLPGSAEARAFAAPLVVDRSPSVRERAEFILRPKTA